MFLFGPNSSPWSGFDGQPFSAARGAARAAGGGRWAQGRVGSKFPIPGPQPCWPASCPSDPSDVGDGCRGWTDRWVSPGSPWGLPGAQVAHLALSFFFCSVCAFSHTSKNLILALALQGDKTPANFGLGSPGISGREEMCFAFFLHLCAFIQLL